MGTWWWPKVLFIDRREEFVGWRTDGDKLPGNEVWWANEVMVRNCWNDGEVKVNIYVYIKLHTFCIYTSVENDFSPFHSFWLLLLSNSDTGVQCLNEICLSIFDKNSTNCLKRPKVLCSPVKALIAFFLVTNLENSYCINIPESAPRNSVRWTIALKGIRIIGKTTKSVADRFYTIKVTPKNLTLIEM